MAAVARPDHFHGAGLVAALPLVGLFFFRLYDNQLIRQTQAELIAQSRVLAAVYAREVEARLDSGITLGAEIPPEARPDPETRSPRSGRRSTLPPAPICCGAGPMRFPRARRHRQPMSRSARG